MIKESLRLIAIILLLIIIIMDDFPFYSKMKDPATQLFLAVLIVAFIYYDATFGFIMGLVLMLIYFEIYKKIINIKNNKPLLNWKNENESISSSNALPILTGSCDVLKMDYISEEHLMAAQNNIFDTDHYNKEVKGIEKGFNNEKVYGVQGLDTEGVNYKGYSKEDNLFSAL